MQQRCFLRSLMLQLAWFLFIAYPSFNVQSQLSYLRAKFVLNPSLFVELENTSLSICNIYLLHHNLLIMATITTTNLSNKFTHSLLKISVLPHPERLFVHIVSCPASCLTRPAIGGSQWCLQTVSSGESLFGWTHELQLEPEWAGCAAHGLSVCCSHSRGWNTR